MPALEGGEDAGGTGGWASPWYDMRWTSLTARGRSYSSRAASKVPTKGHTTGTRAWAPTRSCTQALTETHPGVRDSGTGCQRLEFAWPAAIGASACTTGLPRFSSVWHTLSVLVARGRARVSVSASAADWPKRIVDMEYVDHDDPTAAH